MSFYSLSTLLALGSPQPGQDPKASMVQTVVLFAGMGLVMYFMLIRPQQQQRKKLEQLMTNLRPGDKVVTSSGIVGQVITVREKTVMLRTADSKLELLKSTIADVTEKSGEKSAAEATAEA